MHDDPVKQLRLALESLLDAQHKAHKLMDTCHDRELLPAWWLENNNVAVTCLIRTHAKEALESLEVALRPVCEKCGQRLPLPKPR